MITISPAALVPTGFSLVHLICGAICLLPEIARTDDVPFVAGFDRFGRHHEIDDRMAGRLLLSELSCTACHLSPIQTLQPKRGPRMDGAGSRLQVEWLQKFLNSPQAVSPGTTMPDALSAVPAESKAEVVDALAAFLAAQLQSFPEIKATGASPAPFEFWKHGSVNQGRRLYHRIGCVACHDADQDHDTVQVQPSQIDKLLEELDPEELKELGLTAAARRVKSVPHPNLAAKYSQQSLTYFLLNPESVRPSGRMPNFNLQAVDAADIAAWLLSRTQHDPVATLPAVGPAADPGDSTATQRLVAQGRRLFSKLGCANCHSIRDTVAEVKARPLAELHLDAPDSCLTSTRQRTGQPFFELDEVQQQAVHAALSDPDANASGEVDRLQTNLLQLNCYACHERDGHGGIGRFRKPVFETVGHVDIGDEGRLPPSLTGVGRKLKLSWLNRVFTGKGRLRAHMYVRMPQFPAASVQPLSALLVAADTVAEQPVEQEVFGSTDLKSLAQAGRTLMDVGCVQCHSFRGESLPGTVGIDLEGIAARLQPQWFHDFLLDPGSLKARTRMPTFFPEGRSQNHEVLDGDTEKQIAAMWSYLRDLNQQTLPAKIIRARAQNYELTPLEQPLVLRTFMPYAGTHAIAVGFPQKVHFAFDAEQVTLAEAWRGRFLDAEGTWFVRFAPPADPLGKDLVRLPPGVLLATLTDSRADWPVDAESADCRFAGYRLDKSRTPTFLYSVGAFRIEDRIQPAGKDGLQRRLRIRQQKPVPAAEHLWMRANAGSKLTKTSPLSAVNDRGVTVTVSDGREGELRSSHGTTEWIVPVRANAEEVIQLRYEW